MYVFCVGMYRACSTWQYEVAAHLLEKHRGAARLGYMTGDEFAEYDDAEGRNTAGYKILKSHEEHPRFRATLAEGRAVALYTHRDLRDVVYSLMHKRRIDFDTLLAQGMVHQVLANDRFWMARPHVIVQQYEDLIARPAAGVEELARFLGVHTDPGEAAAIASEYSLQANRRRTADLGRRLRALGVDLENPTNAQHADRETLLHWNHLREGRVGDWRERADDRQRAILARLCNRWLGLRGYEVDSPPVRPGLRGEWAMARGWLSCRLRCAALRHPGPARLLKRLLGIQPPPSPHSVALPTSPGPVTAGTPRGTAPATIRRTDAA